MLLPPVSTAPTWRLVRPLPLSDACEISPLAISVSAVPLLVTDVILQLRRMHTAVL
jgi:hypothetical protein